MTEQTCQENNIIDAEKVATDSNIITIPHRENYEPMPIEKIKNQIQQVSELYKSVLNKDVHYGKIPGVNKDTLLKPGAEKICLMFQLVERVEDETLRDLGNGHREYEITIGLYHRQSNIFWGHGVGTCSTLETKFRYRWINTTLKPNQEDADDMKANGEGRWRKHNNEWVWQRRIENPDIADTFNTVRKMAHKRAYVGATILSTGVSDIFTQDVEDFDNIPDTPQAQKSNQKSATDKVKDNFQGETVFTVEDAIKEGEKCKNKIDAKKWWDKMFSNYKWSAGDNETLTGFASEMLKKFQVQEGAHATNQ